MSNQELAERIKAARKSVGLHMTELAERIGVSSNYISLLERAERNPSDAVLNKIAEATHTTYEWLTTGQGTSPSRLPIPGDRRPSNTPNPRLLLQLLQWHRPEMFPNAVCAILAITPEKLDAYMSGASEDIPEWGLAYELLAQRLDRAAARRALADMDAFLQNITAKVFLKHLESLGEPGYQYQGEQSRQEVYQTGGFDLEVGTLTFIKKVPRKNLVWQFKVVQGSPLPQAEENPAYEQLYPSIISLIQGIIEIQTIAMERNSNEQITLVFYDVDLYSEFVCDAKNCIETWEYRHSCPMTNGPSLILLNEQESKVEEYTCFPYSMKGEYPYVETHRNSGAGRRDTRIPR
jgi:transcriptional regulator with XRE-family HTH domain